MKQIIQFLLHGESIRLKAYPDSGGRWTIGIGNTFYENGYPVKQGDTITQERAFKLAEIVALDICAHIKKHLKHEVNNNQFTALVSFCYNVGKTAFVKSIILKMVNENPNNPLIKEQFPISFITSNGVYNPGLVNRRQSEANLYFKVCVQKR